MSVPSKIIVTGANGFIGTHILMHGIKKYPDYKWVATSLNANKAKTKPWFDKILFIPFDIHSNYESVPFHFKDGDILIHAAWGYLPNITKEEHLIIELDKQKKFLHSCFNNGLLNLSVLGTCSEYGKQNGCMIEDVTPLIPITPYGKAKVELYHWIKDKYPQINLTWMRLFYTYGLGQWEKSLIPQLEKSVSEGKKYFDMSLGEQIRDYLPVEIMAEKILKISLLKKNLGAINICSGNPIKVIDFVKSYIKEKNYDILPNPGAYPYLDYEPFEYWGSTKKYDETIAKFKL